MTKLLYTYRQKFICLEPFIYFFLLKYDLNFQRGNKVLFQNPFGNKIIILVIVCV